VELHLQGIDRQRKTPTTSSWAVNGSSRLEFNSHSLIQPYRAVILVADNRSFTGHGGCILIKDTNDHYIDGHQCYPNSDRTLLEMHNWHPLKDNLLTFAFCYSVL